MKKKILIIFKLVISIIYFVPSFFIMAFGLVMNLIFMIGAAGDSKLHDTSNYIEAMKYIGIFSVIPLIICIILFIITLISTIKYFKNKYNKKMDLFVSFVLLIINISLMTFAFWSAFYKIGIILTVATIILLLDIIFIFKNNRNEKNHEIKLNS